MSYGCRVLGHHWLGTYRRFDLTATGEEMVTWHQRCSRCPDTRPFVEKESDHQAYFGYLWDRFAENGAGGLERLRRLEGELDLGRGLSREAEREAEREGWAEVFDTFARQAKLPGFDEGRVG